MHHKVRQQPYSALEYYEPVDGWHNSSIEHSNLYELLRGNLKTLEQHYSKANSKQYASDKENVQAPAPTPSIKTQKSVKLPKIQHTLALQAKHHIPQAPSPSPIPRTQSLSKAQQYLQAKAVWPLLPCDINQHFHNAVQEVKHSLPEPQPQKWPNRRKRQRSKQPSHKRIEAQFSDTRLQFHNLQPYR